MSARHAILLLASAVLLLAAPRAPAQQPIPRLAARVTDQTGTLTPGEVQLLEQRLQQFETAKGSQLAVLIVPTTEPEEIEQYGIRVAEAWKIGRGKVDDGLILVVAKNDRALRFEVGYGLEGALPDAIAKRIIEETIVPLFRQGAFFGGIQAGLEQAMKVIEGEPLPPPATGSSAVSGDPGAHLWPLVIGIVFVGQALRAVLGRFLGGLAGGVLAGIVAGFILGSMAVAALVGVVVFFLVLFGAVGGSGGGYRGSSSRGFGGGFSSGGGGGFRGGGGGFGGGGASGRW